MPEPTPPPEGVDGLVVEGDTPYEVVRVHFTESFAGLDDGAPEGSRDDGDSASRMGSRCVFIARRGDATHPRCGVIESIRDRGHAARDAAPAPGTPAASVPADGRTRSASEAARTSPARSLSRSPSSSRTRASGVVTAPPRRCGPTAAGLARGGPSLAGRPGCRPTPGSAGCTCGPPASGGWCARRRPEKERPRRSAPCAACSNFCRGGLRLRRRRPLQPRGGAGHHRSQRPRAAQTEGQSRIRAIARRGLRRRIARQGSRVASRKH